MGWERHPVTADERDTCGTNGPGEGEAGSLRPRQLRRLQRCAPHGDRDVFGEGPPLDVVLAVAGDDLVAGLEGGHGRSDGLDNTCHVPARHQWEMDGIGAVQVAPQHFPVDRVQPGGPGPHDDGVRTQLGVLHIGDVQHVVVAVPVGCYGSHRSTPSPGCPPVVV